MANCNIAKLMYEIKSNFGNLDNKQLEEATKLLLDSESILRSNIGLKKETPADNVKTADNKVTLGSFIAGTGDKINFQYDLKTTESNISFKTIINAMVMSENSEDYHRSKAIQKKIIDAKLKAESEGREFDMERDLDEDTKLDNQFAEHINSFVLLLDQAMKNNGFLDKTFTVKHVATSEYIDRAELEMKIDSKSKIDANGNKIIDGGTITFYHGQDSRASIEAKNNPHIDSRGYMKSVMKNMLDSGDIELQTDIDKIYKYLKENQKDIKSDELTKSLKKSKMDTLYDISFGSLGSDIEIPSSIVDELTYLPNDIGGNLKELVGVEFAYMLQDENNIHASVGEMTMHEVYHAYVEQAMQKDQKLFELTEMLRKDLAPKLKYQDLLADKENPTKEEVQLAKDTLAYLSSSASEFAAYFSTNRNVFKALSSQKLTNEKFSKFKLPENKKSLEFVFKEISNLIIDVLNKVVLSMNTLGTTKATDALTELNKRLVLASLERRSKIDNNINPDENQFNEYEIAGISRKYNKAENAFKNMNDKIENIFGSVNNEYDLKDKAKISGMYFEKQLSKIPGLQRLFESRLLSDTWNTIIEDTTKKKDDTADFYRLIRKIKGNRDGVKVRIQNVARQRYSKMLENHSKEERDSMTKMFESDWRGTGLEFNKYIDMLGDDNKIQNQIDKLKDKIGQKEYIRQARDLAVYITQHRAIGSATVRNAYQVYYRHYSSETKGKTLDTGMTADESIRAIDRLASFYAMKYMHSNDIKNLKASYKREPNVIEDISNSYYYYRDREIYGEQFKDFANLFDKGFVKKFNSVDMEFDVVEESNISEDSKFIKDNVVRDLNPSLGSQVGSGNYKLVSRRNYNPARTQGGYDDIGILERGVLLNDFKDLGIDGRKKLEIIENQKLKASNDTDYLNQTFDESFEATLREEDHLLMKTDINGKITDYEFLISYADQKNHGRVSDDVADMLGITIAHTDTKEMAIMNNMRLTDFLLELSDKNNDKPNYILLRPTNEDEKKKGKSYKYAQQWSMIPELTRNYILYKTQGKGIHVDINRLNDIEGYSDPTLANLKFFGRNVLDSRPEMKKAIKVMESTWIEMSKYWKEIVVKLFPDVVLGNGISNLIVAMRHGVGPIEYAKEFKRGWIELGQHVELNDEYVSLELKEAEGDKNAKLRRAAIKKDMERLSIHSLIEDGQFSMILEDIDIEMSQKSSHIEDITSELVKSKVNKDTYETINKLRRGMYLTRDTAAHKHIEKLTIFNDIINKNIIKNRMLQDLKNSNIKNQKLIRDKKQEILDYMDLLFTNYSYLDNKYLKYANDTLLAVFTKYFFRQPKAIISSYTKRPLLSTGFEGVDLTILDFPDPIEQYLSIGDTLAYKASVGPYDVVGDSIFPNIFNIFK